MNYHLNIIRIHNKIYNKEGAQGWSTLSRGKKPLCFNWRCILTETDPKVHPSIRNWPSSIRNDPQWEQLVHFNIDLRINWKYSYAIYLYWFSWIQQEPWLEVDKNLVRDEIYFFFWLKVRDEILQLHTSIVAPNPNSYCCTRSQLNSFEEVLKIRVGY